MAAGSPQTTEVAGSNGNGARPHVVTDEQVRIRAYFLSLEHRGRGNDVDFWLMAERELRSQDTSEV